MSEIDWSKAPEGATHAAFGDDNIPGWYRKEAGCWLFFPDSCGPKAWTADCSQNPERDRPSFIPRPTQWRGPEDGLPPAGTVCEVRYAGEWLRCTVVAHLKDLMGMTDAVFQAEYDWDFHQRPEMFRPLKSDKERAVEAAMDNWCRGKIVNTLEYRARKEFVENLYDAGLLRLPEEQS